MEEFDEINWELRIGKDALQINHEINPVQDTTSLNTTIPTNFTSKTYLPQSSEPKQNISGLLAILFGGWVSINFIWAIKH